MRSADRTRIALLGLLAALPATVGCDSTFQQNARAKLAAERRLAAQDRHVVAERGPDVRVERVTLLRGAGASAVVVDVRNRADRALTDVPISVGVRRGTRKVLLNDGADLDWFQTHLPAVPAGGRATWVFQSPAGERARAGDQPFVRIGRPVRTATSSGARLPSIDARVARTTTNSATVTVERVALPQLGLPVAVVARRGDRPVAAGVVTVPAVDRGESLTVDVPLIGRAGTAPLRAVIAPTIFD